MNLVLRLCCVIYKRKGSFTKNLKRIVPEHPIMGFRSLAACGVEVTETFQG